MVWQDVRRMTRDETQTLISFGVDRPLSNLVRAASKRRHAMVIGIVMVVAAFVVFVVVLRWSA